MISPVLFVLLIILLTMHNRTETAADWEREERARHPFGIYYGWFIFVWLIILTLTCFYIMSGNNQ